MGTPYTHILRGKKCDILPLLVRQKFVTMGVAVSEKNPFNIQTGERLISLTFNFHTKPSRRMGGSDVWVTFLYLRVE